MPARRLMDITNQVKEQFAQPAETPTAASLQTNRAVDYLDLSKKQAANISDAYGRAKGDLESGYGAAANLMRPHVGRGQRYGQMYDESLASAPGTSPYREQAMSIMEASRGPIEEMPGYQNMLQQREEALGDLATTSSAAGKSFSGTRLAAAADISGNLANQLQQQNYERGMNDIRTLMGMESFDYGRDQDRLNRIRELDRLGYDTSSMLGSQDIARGHAVGGLDVTGAGTAAQMLMSGYQGFDQMLARGEQADRQERMYQDQLAQQEKAEKRGFWGDVLGAGAGIVGSVMGGPVGGAIGKWAGDKVGDWLS